MIFALLLAPILVLGAMNPGNVAQTSLDHPDASLRTRSYRALLPVVRGAALHTISTLKTYGRVWRVKPPENGLKPLNESQIGVTVPVLFFSDDVQITLREENGETIVDARSASRVGKGDFGENARHLRQLLNALDAQLPQE